MLSKNIYSKIQQLLPYHLLQKIVVQLCVCCFFVGIGTYGMKLFLHAKTAVPYDFTFVDTLNANGEHDNQQGTEEDEHDPNVSVGTTPISQKINIRTATKTELMTLPQIGSKKADEILLYRETYGFDDISDMLQVKGIGTKTYEALKPYIQV